MSLSKIKEQYQTAFVAFGKSGLPLGERTDIDDLAIIAHKSGNKTLFELFEVIPPLDALLQKKTVQDLPVLTPVDEVPLKKNEEKPPEEVKPAEEDLPEVQTE